MFEFRKKPTDIQPIYGRYTPIYGDIRRYTAIYGQKPIYTGYGVFGATAKNLMNLFVSVSVQKLAVQCLLTGSQLVITSILGFWKAHRIWETHPINAPKICCLHIGPFSDSGLHTAFSRYVSLWFLNCVIGCLHGAFESRDKPRIQERLQTAYNVDLFSSALNINPGPNP